MHICWKRFYLSSPIEWVPHVNCFLPLLVEWICFRLLPFSHIPTISRECPRSTGLSKLFAVFKLGKRYLNTYMAKWTNVKIHETWNSSFKYFGVVRIEKQIRSFVLWEKFWLDNFVSRSTDLFVEQKNLKFLSK